jgi:hypothetical protein
MNEYINKYMSINVHLYVYSYVKYITCIEISIYKHTFIYTHMYAYTYINEYVPQGQVLLLLVFWSIALLLNLNWMEGKPQHTLLRSARR